MGFFYYLIILSVYGFSVASASTVCSLASPCNLVLENTSDNTLLSAFEKAYFTVQELEKENYELASLTDYGAYTSLKVIIFSIPYNYITFFIGIIDIYINVGSSTSPPSTPSPSSFQYSSSTAPDMDVISIPVPTVNLFIKLNIC